ncbi:hypothetical protein H0H92_005211 [Tricholoma furcatifolium]|nr:hypothetical protein H0H92_005211 [Tricholoma furcatifolium]
MQPPPDPPTKPSLKSWIHNLTAPQKVKKETEWKQGTPRAFFCPKTVLIRRLDEPQAISDGPVFGVPLKESLKHASAQISTATAEGQLYVWGTVPVVVAKCGGYLKAKATEVPGTFRINGSARRTRDLQDIFERSPEFGRKLNWAMEIYTTHDIATVFRRYLTHMPEPVIPYDMYHSFRDPLARPKYNTSDVIATYQELIKQMPQQNEHLLLYVLDLLSVFALKSQKNLMTASNLAVIFRPGLISHPNHETSPQEFELSQNVLQFLIEHQDHFMLDIPPPPNGAIKSIKSQNPDMDDVLSVPSSDEELSNVGPGGWKAVTKGFPLISRRRITVRSKEDLLNKDDSMITSASPGNPLSAKQIKRSRTLPSRRIGAQGEELPRVLRKSKRPQPPAPIDGDMT